MVVRDGVASLEKQLPPGILLLVVTDAAGAGVTNASTATIGTSTTATTATVICSTTGSSSSSSSCSIIVVGTVSLQHVLNNITKNRNSNHCRNSFGKQRTNSK
mmetsp:Transcript_31127/g.75225  ORF Transcript_31127/g.75225 Transcript_31127/m.75225 type:complete len:103 (+) Transcript_31127:2622-2930(+)